MKNKITIILLLLIICALSVATFMFYKKAKGDNELVLYGNIDVRQVNLAFRIGGRLEKMKMEEGDLVKKGDVLAVLDREPVLHKFQQAKAQVEQARINFQNADNMQRRSVRSCKDLTISKQDCDGIKFKRDAAKANYDYAKAILAEASTALKDTQLRAPSDGMITTRIQENGAMLGAGVPVYTLSLNNSMWARAYIPETELGKVRIGDRVAVYTDSTTKAYNGQIGFISPVAEFTPKNIETTTLRTDLVYRVRIQIKDADTSLKQGMPITIKLNRQ